MVGIALHVLDKAESAATVARQAMRRSAAVDVSSMHALSSEAVALRLKREDSPAPAPGSTVWLHIPAISRTEWHPFTVADVGAEMPHGAWAHVIKVRSAERPARAPPA